MRLEETVHGSSIQGVLITCAMIEFCSVNSMKNFGIQ